MDMFAVPQKLDKYLNCELRCSCGRTHYVPIKEVKIGSCALNTLPELVQKYGYKYVYLICDEITYQIAGKQSQNLLKNAGVSVAVHILSHLDFDESTLGEIIINIPDDCDLMIGCGTGSITDIVRYSSYKLKLPCYTVATGAPMDGFAASIGIMNVNNLKATMQAHCSEVIIGDTDILKTAPYRMTVAGFGDLIGKITCLNDWTLSKIINEEHYCPNIVSLVKDCVEKILADSEHIKEKDPEILGKVMEGLVLSGAAISLYGDSRPASGAEHHMSHFWEALFNQSGETRAMHGEQVAVGTVLVLMLAEELLQVTPDFSSAKKYALSYNASEWEKQIHTVFGTAADEIIKLEKKAGKNEPKARLKRIENIERNWETIVSQLESLPSSAKLKKILDNVGCPSDPKQIGVSKSMLKDTFMFCKEVRNRYTIFQLTYDLGLLDQLSDLVIEKISY